MAADGGKSLEIVLVGCGKMGSAMLRGWLEKNIAGHCIIIDPKGAAGAPDLENHEKVTVIRDLEDFPAETKPDVVVLAVKPQIMDRVIPSYRGLSERGGLFLSIAAGKTLNYFERHLAPGSAIVRSMPNTPAAIGEGMTFAVANDHTSGEQKEIAETLLSANGEFVWFNDENLMNAGTAISGSGPAYVFLLIETLAQAGEKEGLAPDIAMYLARQTVIGSAALVKEWDDYTAAQLRENVTSPGGTTLEALKVLMHPGTGMQPLFDDAIAANIRRARELGG